MSILIRFCISALFLLLIFPASAQYNKPYRIAWDGSNYYITNKGNGTLSKLDASFRHSTAITGLYSPNDVFFARVAGNSMIAIIDSNAIKLFDSSSLSLVLNIPIQGAAEAHDGAVNPLNNNEFFISDRVGNRIIKGSIGPAPFYPVSFSTLNSTVLRPSGLMFDQNNRLLVVCDTTDGEIYRINTSTGAASLVKNTGIHRLNDMVQDNQGNFYVSNWDDQYVYRYDPVFDSAVAITRFNLPAGLYANVKDDYLVVACMNCGKLDFLAFHALIPEEDLISCAGDSVTVYIDRFYKGIGTYGSGNRFQVVLSDETGNFANSSVIGNAGGTNVPDSIRCIIPKNFKSGSGYKYRLQATQPQVVGAISKKMEVLSRPVAFIFSGNDPSVCAGTLLNLGKDPEPNVVYQWKGGAVLNRTDLSRVVFSSDTLGAYELGLHARDTLSGCRDSAEIRVFVVDVPRILLPDSVHVCERSEIEFGQAGLPWKYSWESPDKLNRNAPIIRFKMGTESIVVSLELSDSSGLCTNRQTVSVVSDSLPKLPIITGSHDEVCRAEPFILKPFNSRYDHLFRCTLPTIDSSAEEISYDTRNALQASWEVTLIDRNSGCRDSIGNQINILPQPDSIQIYRDEPSQHYILRFFGDSLPKAHWLVNGTKKIGYSDSLPFSVCQPGDAIKAVSADPQLKCVTESEVQIHPDLGLVGSARIVSLRVYPNPASYHLHVICSRSNANMKIFDMKGSLIAEHLLLHAEEEIELKNYVSGLYRIVLDWNDGTQASATFMKD